MADLDGLERRVGAMDLLDSDGEEDEVEVPSEEEEAARLRCLLCEACFARPAELWAHMSAEHALDVRAERKRLGLDFYRLVRLVNHLRACTRDGVEWRGSLEEGAAWMEDMALMRPVLEDDAVLCALGDFEEEDEEEAAPAEEEEHKAAAPAGRPATAEDLLRENAALRAKLGEMRDAMRTMGESLERLASSKGGAAVARKEDRDAYYFGSYSGRQIHEEMLRDRVRTEAYRDAFLKNTAAVSGKTVLDIGCGTGILSMFAAKAGARRVVGIDRADIIDKAREIVKANGLADRVTLIKSKTEEAEMPDGVDKVDIIVSEWMGYFLLFESMLPTVLYARDRWLAPGGRLYPDVAIMYVVGVDAAALRGRSVGFWRDVYGFDMSCMVEESDRYRGTVVGVVPAAARVTEPVVLRNFDLMTVTDAELDFESDFELVASRDGDFEAFCVYFDTDFVGGLEHPVKLPTGPEHTTTHWVQTTFYVSAPAAVKAGDRVAATMRASRRKSNPREYDVHISYAVRGGERFTQDFEILAN